MTGNSVVYKRIIAIIISAAVAFVGIFSLITIKSLQGNARVINYAGVVRGGTQKLIKEELQGIQDDMLIKRLDAIIEELITGEGELGLDRQNDKVFQSMMSQMKGHWKEIKEEIMDVRQGGDKDRLFELSQKYYELADQTVSEAERYSKRSADLAAACFLVLAVFFIIVACALLWLLSVDGRRQMEKQSAEEKNKEEQERLSRMEKAIQVPMNEISELIYVSDMENYNLLYINEAGKRTFHLDDISGKKCYKSLQGLDAPCPFCTNDKLKPGENYDWETTNSVTNRHYMLKDRLIEWNGRKARMEIAFDMTQMEDEKEKLKYALDVENMVVEGVKILYQGKDLNQAVNQVLKLMGEFLRAERTYVLIVKDDLIFSDSEWCRQGVESQKALLHGVPLAIVKRWLPVFSEQECIVIKDLEMYRESSPEEYGTLKAQKINSLVIAPMERDGILVGALGVDNPPVEKIENISAPLQTLCYFIHLAYRKAENEQQLSELSFHDTLTSFYNRNRYIKDLDKLSGKNKSVGIIYLDVNGLKEVNDKLGHSEGDKLLVQVANTMNSVFRKEDCYRVGGDEFVIICMNITGAMFQERVAELKKSFEYSGGCRAAIGSQWSDSAANIKQIVSDADASMYEDKKSYYRKNKKVGRYRHLSDEILQLASPAVLQAEIEKQQFVVYLQPRISSSDRTAVGAEALVRYLSKDGSLVMPGQFLTVLEEAKTICQVDFYVCEQVCAKIKEWSDSGKRIVPVSVNFSCYSLMQPEFLKMLKSICQKHGVAPAYLEMEITEWSEEVMGTDMVELIPALRREGFRVTIDHFGTGYVNLYLLSAVEFDALKLDQSMVRDVAENVKSQEIVKSIVGLCKKMRTILVAEGIEKEEQLEALSTCGVEYVQGYLFSEPIPIEEYEKEYMK